MKHIFLTEYFDFRKEMENSSDASRVTKQIGNLMFVDFSDIIHVSEEYQYNN